jgi:subtilase family serine protease
MFPDSKSHLKVHREVALPRTTGAGPPAGALTAENLIAADGINLIPSDGSGQSVGIFSFQGFSADDITAFESALGLPDVSLQAILIDGFNGLPDSGSSEVTADIEMVAAFAPASSILVYETVGTLQGWIDGWSRIAEDNRVKTISCSWGNPESISTSVSFDTQILPQMAAQGQAVFMASDDSGAFANGGTTLDVSEPASQPYATGVGATDLGPSTEQIYLEMYGTGIRHASSVTASVGGVNVPVLFAGPAPGFAGLDQVNIGAAAGFFGGRGKRWDRGYGGWAGGKYGQCQDPMMPAVSNPSWVVALMALTIDESTLQRIGKPWPSRSLRITCFSLAEEADEGVGRGPGGPPHKISRPVSQSVVEEKFFAG